MASAVEHENVAYTTKIAASVKISVVLPEIHPAAQRTGRCERSVEGLGKKEWRSQVDSAASTRQVLAFGGRNHGRSLWP